MNECFPPDWSETITLPCLRISGAEATVIQCAALLLPAVAVAIEVFLVASILFA